MSLSAYVDESQPRTGATYLLSCALVAAENRESLRAALRAARVSGERKVHWHARLPRQRRALVELTASLPAIHLLIVRDQELDEPAERRRRKCLERLLWVLDQRHDVDHVVIESRERKQNLGDRRILDVLRASKAISARLRMDHVVGPAEPLLWLPDIVAGAYGGRLGGDNAIFEPLSGIVEIVVVGP